jgi:AcrR family transcriptional regulator
MGRPAKIDRATVLDASLAVADERGLDGVTMQAVAERLDVTPMALYRHVGDKAALLDGLVERLLTDFPLPDRSLPWAERLGEIGRSVRATARRHPGVFVLLFRLPATTPVARRVRDAVYDALREAGVPEEEVARTERLVSTIVLGFAASEAAGRFGKRPRREIDADYERLEEVVAQLLAASVR